jgi:DNA-binding transcriptional regulator YiaG
METLIGQLQQADFALVLHYIAGIALGWILILFLPTNDEAIQWRQDLMVTNDSADENNTTATTTTTTTTTTTENNITTTWEGDIIPPEELERIRKRFRLTPQQMSRVMELSKEQSTLQPSSKSLTPHQTLNRLVYLCMFLVLAYIIHRDYGNVSTVWLCQLFPKEAKMLGLLKR